MRHIKILVYGLLIEATIVVAILAALNNK